MSEDLAKTLTWEETVIQFIVIILLPVLPLTLTIMPLEELITKFLGVIL